MNMSESDLKKVLRDVVEKAANAEDKRVSEILSEMKKEKLNNLDRIMPVFAALKALKEEIYEEFADKYCDIEIDCAEDGYMVTVVLRPKIDIRTNSEQYRIKNTYITPEIYAVHFYMGNKEASNLYESPEDVAIFISEKIGKFIGEQRAYDR